MRMGKIRAMIVDDSTFAITLIRQILENRGIEVIGEAENVSDAIERARDWNPDLITMDMTLPDGTGIVAADQILKENPRIKVIAVSSMMDPDIVNEAKQVGIRGFVQKPIREELLYDTIDRLFTETDQEEALLQSYEEAFRNSLEENIQKIVDPEASVQKTKYEESLEKFSGYLVSIGIIGGRDGRVLLAFSEDAAKEIAGNIFGKKEVEKKEILALFNELVNVVAGNAISKINSKDRNLRLRLSPPAVFQGNQLELSLVDLSNSSFTAKTKYGSLIMNIGFAGGEHEWM